MPKERLKPARDSPAEVTALAQVGKQGALTVPVQIGEKPVNPVR